MANGVIYCNRCGAQNSAEAKFCVNCGTSFSTESLSPQSPVTETIPAPPPSFSVQAPHVYAAPAPAVRYGGFWIRFVAVLIDGLVLGIVVWPVSAMLAVMIGIAGGSVSMPGLGIRLVRGIVVWALFLLAGWIYEATLESSSRQATLGKMALGLKVTDEYGNRISFARASGRFFAKILSRMILFIGYIMAGFTERKRALHDMIAGTLVIRTL